MDIKTIAEAFKDFIENSPPGLSPIQVASVKTTFYSGAATTLMLIVDGGHLPQVTDALLAELVQYTTDLDAEAAGMKH